MIFALDGEKKNNINVVVLIHKQLVVLIHKQLAIPHHTSKNGLRCLSLQLDDHVITNN